jgi:acyl transferase domain-containing protein
MVAARGRLLEDLPAGAMIAVSLPEAELCASLPPGLAIAAVNAPDQCVVSGPRGAVADFADALERCGAEVRRLRITAAAHSVLVEPVMARFAETVAGLRLRPPALPMLSDHTGRWLTGEQACDPAYWAGHLRSTVRFGDALAELLATDGRHALLEVGPGGTLTSLARRHPAHQRTDLLLTSLPHAAADEPEAARLLDTAGQLWLAGWELDWPGLADAERPGRVPLPTTRFRRLRFRISEDPAVPVAIAPAEPADAEDDDEDYLAPRDELERAVADAFERILGADRVGATDSFLDLGGDSLIAARLTGWIRERYRVPVTVKEILQTPTVEALAGRIAAAPADTRTEPQEGEHVG